MEARDATAEERPETFLDVRSQQVLHVAARLASTVEGDVVELGVARGGSTALLADALPDRRIIAVDSFAGLQDHGAFDPPADGEWFMPDEGVTRAKLSRYANVELVVGHFPDPGVLEQIGDGPFALAHYDADLYEPAMAFFEYVWPRLVPGGVLVVDDYGPGSHWAGVYAAVRDFFGRAPSLWSGRQALHVKELE